MAHDPSESAVVVAVDVAGDPSAPLRLGAELARLLAVPVVLAAVLSDGPALGVAEDERRTPTQWRDDLLALGRTVEGVAVADAWAIAAGSPERGLQEVTERPGVTAVVIGSSDRAGGGRVLAGSVGNAW